MADHHLPLLTRRQILLGGTAAAGAVLLGACGSDGADESSATTTTASDGGDGLVLAQFFGGPMFVAGTEARLPFGVGDRDGLLSADDTPTSLDVQVLGPDGDAVGDAVRVARHSEGLPRPYFPLRTTLPEAGIYTARTEIDGTATEMSFQIHAAKDVQVVGAGDPMPAVETPTVADAHGVDPICTREPECPLHDVTLSAALGEGRPIGLLVSTPAFCQLAICGPVLEVLLAVHEGYPDVRFLHAEVYARPNQDPGVNAPIVDALRLHFEPCLLLVGADGRVVERLDTIFDQTELVDRLDALT